MVSKWTVKKIHDHLNLYLIGLSNLKYLKALSLLGCLMMVINNARPRKNRLADAHSMAPFLILGLVCAKE